MKMPFGKHRGVSLELINSNYLRWLIEEDWFIDRDDDLVVAVEEELKDRDKWDNHFYDDKVK